MRRRCNGLIVGLIVAALGSKSFKCQAASSKRESACRLAAGARRRARRRSAPPRTRPPAACRARAQRVSTPTQRGAGRPQADVDDLFDLIASRADGVCSPTAQHPVDGAPLTVTGARARSLASPAPSPRALAPYDATHCSTPPRALGVLRHSKCRRPRALPTCPATSVLTTATRMLSAGDDRR